MHTRRTAVLLAAVLALAACENNPLQLDDDHPDVNGVVFVRNGQVLARVAASSTVTGQIQVPAGGTVGIVVVVFDKDGETVPLGSGESVEITVANAARATFDPVSPGASSGTFRGLSPGSTTFTLRLLHGTPAHADWVSPSIPLVVTQ